jgi:exodeoxyribonuclease VII large subunit
MAIEPRETGSPEKAARPNVPEYSVSELSQSVKRSIEERFGLVRVRGEISKWMVASSGHAYPRLKDASAVLDCVMWKGAVSALRFRPEDGLEVICTGKLTTYPGKSAYQLVIERMEPAGVGALMALLEERKRKLAAEGLFAAERKRALPFLPNVIGVITSPTGAVIRDILHRLADRFPRRVLVWPVLVQGEQAAGQIAAAIQGFNALTPGGPIPRPDVLIVARGGGSLEDLWAFNEEAVVRAAADSAIPLISAVGHETDTTLIDFASDRRAPTPTAAAEMAVPVKADLDYTVGDLGLRLDRALSRGLIARADRIAGLSRGLPSPRALLGLAQQRFDDLAERLPRALGQGVLIWRGRTEQVAARLQPSLLLRDISQKREAAARAGAQLERGVTLRFKDAGQQLAKADRLQPSLLVREISQTSEAVTRASVA